MQIWQTQSVKSASAPKKLFEERSDEAFENTLKGKASGFPEHNS
jgi:hypothetical protein